MESPHRTDDIFQHGLPRLKSERLVLRHPRRSDAPDLLEIFGDLETLRYWSHGPLDDVPAMESYIEGMELGCLRGTSYQWIVQEKESQRAIGTVIVARWNQDHGRAEVGFALNRAFQGRGFAGEALEAALAFGFGEMGLHRFEADVDPENAASIVLLERIGFRREGYLPERWFTYGAWRDTVLFGLLRDTWAGRGESGRATSS